MRGTDLSEEGERSFWPGVVLQGRWDGVENDPVLWECWFEITGGEQQRERREAGKGCGKVGKALPLLIHREKAVPLLSTPSRAQGKALACSSTKRADGKTEEVVVTPGQRNTGLICTLDAAWWAWPYGFRENHGGWGGSSQEAALQQEGRIMGWKEPLNSASLSKLFFICASGSLPFKRDTWASLSLKFLHYFIVDVSVKEPCFNFCCTFERWH